MTDKAYLIRSIAHAPPASGVYVPQGLAGWILGNGTLVCATCWGRVVARGCGGGSTITPRWDNLGGPCAGCGEVRP